MPDYHLYDAYVNEKLANGGKRTEFKYYLDYSIGFLTRGCFRKCPFCVNRNYSKASIHSPLNEFLDPDRKKICLLDDNFLSHPGWKEMLLELRETGKAFRFNQGLDERLLTNEKCELLFSSKYDSDITFAFDDVNDYELIEDKMKLIRKYTNTAIPRFYVLCGFDRNGKYDSEFWRTDITDTFRRIELIMKYKMIPYIMRYDKYKDSPHRGIYITLARWVNQPSFFKKTSFAEFCAIRADSQRYLDGFLAAGPDFDKHYLEMKY